MRKLVRLYHGMKMQGKKCKFCDMKRDCIVLRQDFYWRFRFPFCGHEVGGSYVLPPSELIRMGIVNRQFSQDPRATAAINLQIQDGMRIIEERKRQRWIAENLAGGKRYL